MLLLRDHIRMAKKSMLNWNVYVFFGEKYDNVLVVSVRLKSW